MNNLNRPLSASVVLAATLCTASAQAQQDINPPLPNVMLLVDTSGSMELMADGTRPDTCSPTDNASDLNRWGSLVTVLTGTVQNRSCLRQQRSSAAFVNEYSIGGIAPYDRYYPFPHHRIVSNGCVAGPGLLPANAYDWPAGAINYHDHTSATVTCAAPGFAQATDGLMDVYRDRLRFGLMTFDAHTDPGTGVSGNTPDISTGMSGIWSYYDNWQGGGTPAQGNPPSCALSLHEVGARNASAPPWEGRMIPFGSPTAPIASVHQTNDHIQEALLALRPYGATPLAGMLQDAYTFFRTDTSNHPLNTAEPFAPAGDPYYNNGCRQSYIILLSDGEPNLDLRPYCESGDGVCPFQETHVSAHELANPTNVDLTVNTFAIGFGLSSGAGFNCSTLDPTTDFAPGGQCNGATGALKACCTLSRIAFEGGTGHAYFADDLTTLKSELSKILELISAESTSRTIPAYAGATSTQAINSNAPAVAYEITSSFRPGQSSLWSGNLERHRWECRVSGGVLQAELQPVDSAKGDDFAENLNSGKLTRPRQFITVVSDLVSAGAATVIDSRNTIRPHLTNNDGIGLYGGTSYYESATGMAGVMQAHPKAMEMDPLPASCGSPQLGGTTPAQCAQRVMLWELGGNNGGGLPVRQADLGAIYHSSPAVVGAPRAFIRDLSYERFAGQQAHRPVMLYTATTDGQLHAFKVASNDASETVLLADQLDNNELWSFLPPFVLPGLLSQYPAIQQILLDGTPVVKDVFFERTLPQAQAGGTASGAQWRTVLVAGGRGGGGFYYALDVTDPTAPQFLWQIAGIRGDTPMFSDMTGTPAITTIRYDDGTGAREVSVAILPGGTGTVDPDPSCTASRQPSSLAHIDASYLPRSSVRCWNAGPGRSLTIVRLSDGEVLKRFQRDTLDGPTSTLSPSRIQLAAFDSPITSQPVAYPSQVGQLADRIYVGDADGTLFRVNLSNPDPTQWDVDIMFDAYSLGSDSATDGEPVETTPVVAVDGLGNTVVLFSTSDQEAFHATSTMKTRLWSITEEPVAISGTPFSVSANWLIPFSGGKRVTGPIALFDEVAYFSTFEPQSGAGVCSDGYGSLWGVDFVQSFNGGYGPQPEPRLPVDPNATPLVFVDELPQAPGTVVFGVAVTQQPACFDTASVNDELIGTYNSITQSTPPTFTLSFHTGATGTAAPGSITKATRRVLPSPKQTTRIDSWASAVE